MKVINGFLKWLALLVITLFAGLLVIIFLAANPGLDIFWLRIIMLAATAFIGSLICRIFFHRLPGFFLFFNALITQVLSLLIIDYFYEIDYRLSFLSIDFVLQTPSVSDAAQGIFLLIISLPTLFFLRRRKKTPKIRKGNKPPKAARPKFSLRQKIDPVLVRLNPANWQFPKDIQRKTKKLFNRSKQTVKSKVVQISTGKSKSAAAPRKNTTIIKTPQKKATNKKLSISGKRKQNHLNDVKLTGEEEHVCPYCLERVNKNDPHGIVVCPECNTWHHQDCWDLTGTCGVAHRNEL